MFTSERRKKRKKEKLRFNVEREKRALDVLMFSGGTREGKNK